MLFNKKNMYLFDTPIGRLYLNSTFEGFIQHVMIYPIILDKEWRSMACPLEGSSEHDVFVCT